MTIEIALLALVLTLLIRRLTNGLATFRKLQLPTKAVELKWSLMGLVYQSGNTLINPGNFEPVSFYMPKRGIAQKILLVSDRGAIALDVGDDIQSRLHADVRVVVHLVLHAVPNCDVEITGLMQAPECDVFELQWQIHP